MVALTVARKVWTLVDWSAVKSVEMWAALTVVLLADGRVVQLAAKKVDRLVEWKVVTTVGLMEPHLVDPMVDKKAVHLVAKKAELKVVMTAAHSVD